MQRASLVGADPLSSILLGATRSGEGEIQPNEDATSGMAVMMSVYATAVGGVGVAYINTAFRNLGLLQFQDTAELKDLESVVVQVGNSLTEVFFLSQTRVACIVYSVSTTCNRLRAASDFLLIKHGQCLECMSYTRYCYDFLQKNIFCRRVANVHATYIAPH